MLDDETLNHNLHINPLTPMPPVTGRDKPWTLFHLLRHHVWPKLASSILKFCRRKRSFQWYPDQSDRLSGSWNMHENAKKSWVKNSEQNFLNYAWLLRGKNFPSRWCFLGNLLNWKQAQKKVSNYSKKIRKGEKGKRNLHEKPKDKGHFLVQTFMRMLVERTGILSCCKCFFWVDWS